MTAARVGLEQRGPQGFETYRPLAEKRLIAALMEDSMTAEEAGMEAASTVSALLVRALADPSTVRLYDILTEDGRSVGVIGVTLHRERHFVFVWDIFINEVSRGLGYGSAALEQIAELCCDWAASIRLTTATANVAARGCFARAGFRETSFNLIRRLDGGSASSGT